MTILEIEIEIVIALMATIMTAKGKDSCRNPLIWIFIYPVLTDAVMLWIYKDPYTRIYMSERYTKFHIRVKQGKGLRRTTVSIESIIAELFALRLGHNLDTADGHKAVREWLQERQDEQNMSYTDSGLLKRQMLLQIVDKVLLRKLENR